MPIYPENYNVLLKQQTSLAHAHTNQEFLAGLNDVGVDVVGIGRNDEGVEDGRTMARAVKEAFAVDGVARKELTLALLKQQLTRYGGKHLTDADVTAAT